MGSPIEFSLILVILNFMTMFSENNFLPISQKFRDFHYQVSYYEIRINNKIHSQQFNSETSWAYEEQNVFHWEAFWNILLFHSQPARAIINFNFFHFHSNTYFRIIYVRQLRKHFCWSQKLSGKNANRNSDNLRSRTKRSAKREKMKRKLSFRIMFVLHLFPSMLMRWECGWGCVRHHQGEKNVSGQIPFLIQLRETKRMNRLIVCPRHAPFAHFSSARVRKCRLFGYE